MFLRHNVIQNKFSRHKNNFYFPESTEKVKEIGTVEQRPAGKQNLKDDLSPVVEDEEQRRSLMVIYTHRLFVEQNGND